MRGFNFNSIPAPKLKRSTFNLGHQHILTAGMGKLIPFACFEGLPGDTFKITTANFMRLQPMLAPIMHRVDCYIDWYKVPVRLIWDDYENFFTGGKSGDEKPTPPHIDLEDLDQYISGVPQFVNSAFGVGSLAQYLGVPLALDLSKDIPDYDINELSGQTGKIGTLPFRAYQRIYYENYVDQNLANKSVDDISKASGKEDMQYFLQFLGKLQTRCWKKDYFTSALPEPQRGDTVTIPVVDDLQISADGDFTFAARGIGQTPGSRTNLEVQYGAEQEQNVGVYQNGPGFLGAKYQSGLQVDGLSPIAITALRTAFKLQQFLERNNIAGSRYIENVLAHFGVHSSDARMDRCEYLGGGSMPIVISPVEQTSATQDDTTSLGFLAGKGTSNGVVPLNKKVFCEEHCLIMGIVSIIPKAAYYQGLPRMFTRFDKLDYFWSEFQSIGEQEIKNKELMLFSANPEDTFGYQSRYSEYKWLPDRISGDFATTLAYWHLGRLFKHDPTLSEKFMQVDQNNRPFALDTADARPYLLDMYISIKAKRPMSIYSTPSIT